MAAQLQQTIKKSVTVAGVGLHTGQQVEMTFHPAPPNHGYKFRRVDVAGQPVIEADADLVIDTARGTTIARNGVKVSTIEHTLAALVGMGVDNVMIDLNASETPIMDGSSKVFVEAIAAIGLDEQDAERECIEIKENLNLVDVERNTEMMVLPEIGRASCRERV